MGEPLTIAVSLILAAFVTTIGGQLRHRQGWRGSELRSDAEVEKRRAIADECAKIIYPAQLIHTAGSLQLLPYHRLDRLDGDRVKHTHAADLSTPRSNSTSLCTDERADDPAAAALLRELLSDTCTTAELCCGDCSAQSAIYRSQLHSEPIACDAILQRIEHV